MFGSTACSHPKLFMFPDSGVPVGQFNLGQSFHIYMGSELACVNFLKAAPPKGDTVYFCVYGYVSIGFGVILHFSVPCISAPPAPRTTRGLTEKFFDVCCLVVRAELGIQNQKSRLHERANVNQLIMASLL